MEWKPPSGLTDYERYQLKKIRERADFFKPRRETIYVDGEKSFVNHYNSLVDRPGSPFRRNFLLLNASPHGMLQVSRKTNTEYGWSPRIISTKPSVPNTPKRAMSSMDLRKSELYASAEDLRLHAIRKAGSYDDILSRDRLSSGVPPSESGISDVDSIFCIDDDVQSHSSFGLADRSFTFSELEEINYESQNVLNKIDETEVMEDSGNQGSEALSNATSTTIRRLSHGQIDAGVLTEELLRLKAAQEKKRIRKAQDVKAYIENNYPNRNFSTTSTDSCLGDSIKTDISDAESSQQDYHKFGFKSRRKLTYSSESPPTSIQDSCGAGHNKNDDIITISTETTNISNLPGTYQHELHKNQSSNNVTKAEALFPYKNPNLSDFNNHTDTIKTEVIEETTFFPFKNSKQSDDDLASSSTEILYIKDGVSSQFNEDETDTGALERDVELNESKYCDSDRVQESIDTVYFSDSNTNADKVAVLNLLAKNENKCNSERENSFSEDKEEIITVTETIQFEDQSVQLSDESSISLEQVDNASLEFLIREQSVSDSHGQMSEVEHVLNKPENLSKTENKAHIITSQSQISFNPTIDKLADDSKNSRHFTSIDKKPTHYDHETTVVIKELECTSKTPPSRELKIDQLTSDDSSCYDEYVLEGKHQTCNLSLEESRRIQPGRTEVINTLTEVNSEIYTYRPFDCGKETIKIQNGELNNSKTSGVLDNEESTVQTQTTVNTVTSGKKDLDKNDAHVEQFCENVKLFEQVDNRIIDKLKEESVERGVDRIEHFITKDITNLGDKEVKRLKFRLSKSDINNFVYLGPESDTLTHNTISEQEISLSLPFTEKFIDRREKFIIQSNDRLVIRHNTGVNISHLPIDFYQCTRESDISSKIRAHYSGDKDIGTILDSANMDDGKDNNLTVEKKVIYEEEEWDNLEDFRPITQTGVKINVIRNKTPNLTRYKMQTISEKEENFSGESDLNQFSKFNKDKSSIVVSQLAQNTGTEINRFQRETINFTRHRDQKTPDFYNVFDSVNSFDIQGAQSIKPKSVAHAQTFNTYQSPQFKSSHCQYVNLSQDWYLPVTPQKDFQQKSTETIHESNMSLGEIGQENMGKSFQFVRDKCDSPEEVTLEATGTLHSHTNQNLSLISDPGSIYQASCSAEFSDLDESGYVTNLFHDEVTNESLHDTSHDSDSSSYRAVCTAEVNIEIPGFDRPENILSTQNSVSMSPQSEISEAESGYYTLTKSGKAGLSRQDTSEDMTSFIDQVDNKTVYRAQMHGTMIDDGTPRLERVLSTEDITSFAESYSLDKENFHNSTQMSQSAVSGAVFNRVNSQEDMTSFIDAQTLQEFIDYSESLERSFELEEQRLLSESNEESSFAEMSSENLVTESVTNSQPKSKKTVIELFDSNEDLTGCIEYEMDDDETDELKTKNVIDKSEGKFTDNLSRSLGMEDVVTSRKYSMDAMEISDGSLIGIKRVKSTEDMTSFEKGVETTEKSHSAKEFVVDLEKSGILKHANSSEDITSFENASISKECSQTSEIMDTNITRSNITKCPMSQIHRVNSSEDITSFERTHETTEHSVLHHNDQKDIDKSLSISQILPSKDEEQKSTTTTTTVETTTIHDVNAQFGIDTSTRFLSDTLNATMKLQDSGEQTGLDAWQKSVEAFSLLSSSKTFEPKLLQLMTSESGVDHSEKFEQLTDKEKNKLQMFIIYQDFAQMRERSRLKRQLGLLSKQFERLDSFDGSDKTAQLLNINTLLDSFLMNLKVTENLEVLKLKFEKVSSFKSASYHHDDEELCIIMEKFSKILRDLELHRDNFNLFAKLTYCLKFLKTKNLDSTFDSLCDFVCDESQKEDMELLQNHLCLTKEGDFGSRRLLKYLGRGFSRDMGTIWRPKLRVTLQSVCENSEMDFNENCVSEGDESCCEFHSSDKGLCAELDLWSNRESTLDLSPASKRKCQSRFIH